MKPQSSKAKARVLQQWVRDLLLDLVPTLEEDDVRSTGMGQSGEDIQLSPAARKKIPFSIECKNRGSVAVYPWFNQAKGNCPKGSTPILVIKQNRSKPLVIMDAETFFKEVLKDE